MCRRIKLREFGAESYMKWRRYKKVKVNQSRYRPGVAQRVPGS